MIRKLKIILEMIKFEHTVFALPFAFFGAVLGSAIMNGTLPTISQWIWITLAMVGARSAAMSLNRVIDAQIDKKNPRTESRAIPAGLLSKLEVIIFIIASFALLFVAAFQLNMLAVYLLPIAVFFLVIYSYTKRFTWACHVILGVTIAIAPLGGWVGATGTLTWEAFVLFLAVAMWTTGFDVIYATQDLEYDRDNNVYSIPSRFGLANSLKIAKGFHIVSFLAFLALYFFTPLGWLYLIGVIIAGFIMIYEHSIISADDMSRLDVAFFTMNGILSIQMFVFAIGDVLLL
ncbi:prenyltransferase [Alkalihalobacillus alcalophilus ATCC 27647 = CGMCC 1.3604]|uniref:4-hydroxybenzoate polyprenyltransferase n=1 Tax=Alkalihalobacillus alcalophilus ATCC 27647 = CGMCC 1.3604 TaxID=1218173 RepID=A0A4S4K317_ALKAL|nr:UbiA-like polyprenyltransferase [Alkalihalobacillus alcalophilus]MED1560496.1 UbiA-like polyprenyltransferase [Alkalihalobacillus alcalophilus]THG92035.1 prenyltransferase [Alkalihalobacillus alcalophilus ATCC 27647 = CGMCC 1.3604]